MQLSGYVVVKGTLAANGTLGNLEAVDTDQFRLATPALQTAKRMKFVTTAEAPVTIFVRMEWFGQTGESRITEVSSPDAVVDTGGLLNVSTSVSLPVEITVVDAPVFKAPGVFEMIAFNATLTGDLELVNIGPASSALPGQFSDQAVSALGQMRFSGALKTPIGLVVTYAWAGKPDGTYGLFDIKAPDAKPRPTIVFTPYAVTQSQAQESAPASAAPPTATAQTAAGSEADKPFDISRLPEDVTAVELIGLNSEVLSSGRAKFAQNGNRYLDGSCLTSAYPYLVSRHYWDEADKAIALINDVQTGFGARPATVALDRGNFGAVCADQSKETALRAALGNDVMAPRTLKRLCEISGSSGQAQYAPPPSHVMLGMGNVCLDLDYIEEEEIDACMRTASRTRLRTPDLTMDEYCRCSGKLRAEYFGYGKTAVSSSSLVQTATTARSVCDNVIQPEVGAKRFR